MSETQPHPGPSIYTIGHSNHPLEVFIELLRSHRIQVLVDTRSSPYSKYTTHFNSDCLKPAVNAAGVGYLYLGRELGGRPQGDEFYDAEGHVLYSKVAESRPFRDGIARVMKGIQSHRIALLCSEEDPAGCHRRLLVGRVLTEQGVSVQHIRGDGRVQSEEEVARAVEQAKPDHNQPLLFAIAEPTEWRSIQSVSGKKQPSSSSGP